MIVYMVEQGYVNIDGREYRTTTPASWNRLIAWLRSVNASLIVFNESVPAYLFQVPEVGG